MQSTIGCSSISPRTWVPAFSGATPLCDKLRMLATFDKVLAGSVTSASISQYDSNDRVSGSIIVLAQDMAPACWPTYEQRSTTQCHSLLFHTIAPVYVAGFREGVTAFRGGLEEFWGRPAQCSGPVGPRTFPGTGAAATSALRRSIVRS